MAAKERESKNKNQFTTEDAEERGELKHKARNKKSITSPQMNTDERGSETGLAAKELEPKNNK